ncbi:MAG: hypothetical protein Ta2E_05960 [Mycoplasmoidaceae bacterium]|nr:MAG: hypothetical protein Ta2E_05960 [Mycoplasmoidaceae bacterium]
MNILGLLKWKKKIKKVKEKELVVIAKYESQNFRSSQCYNFDSLKTMFSDPYYEFICIRKKGELIGYTISNISDKVDIIKIFVCENERKKGYGKLMMNYIQKKYKGKKVILEVNEDNTGARNFYSRIGFNQVGVRKDYNGEGKNSFTLEG